MKDKGGFLHLVKTSSVPQPPLGLGFGVIGQYLVTKPPPLQVFQILKKTGFASMS